MQLTLSFYLFGRALVKNPCVEMDIYSKIPHISAITALTDPL